MLELINVSKVYRTGTFGAKKLNAVNNVSFSVKDGEVISLIGESGSGKTTIGKMILRLISVTSGTIKFNGVDISAKRGKDLKDYYRNVQGVFQDPFSSYNPIFKTDRMFKIIRKEFFPQIKSQEWNKKVEDSLSAVGLNPPDVLNKFPHQLSGGQLQRFLIARALLLDVKFLVADEIISMLDASTRIDVLNLMAGLKAHGLSILFITHDLSLGYYIGERAVILYGGNIVEMGTTDQIYYNPLHPYTKMLMASVPRLDKKWGEEDVELKVKKVKADNLCVYSERCPETDDKKNCQNLTLQEAENGHFVACDHFALFDNKKLQGSGQ
jgi:peptide/nickel transport system ATP-binding protein